MFIVRVVGADSLKSCSLHYTITNSNKQRQCRKPSCLLYNNLYCYWIPLVTHWMFVSAKNIARLCYARKVTVSITASWTNFYRNKRRRCLNRSWEKWIWMGKDYLSTLKSFKLVTNNRCQTILYHVIVVKSAMKDCLRLL